MSLLNLGFLIVLLAVLVGAGLLVHRYRDRERQARQRVEALEMELGDMRNAPAVPPHHDPVTLLPNHRAFLETLQLHMEDARLRQKALAVGAFSIRDLEQIEQAHGYLVVEELLRNVAREMTLMETTLATVAPGLFGLVFKDVYNLSEATTRAKQVIANISGEYEIGLQGVPVELFAGLALFPEHADEPQDLLRKARLAWHKSRSDGGALTVYQPDIELQSEDQISLGELKSVLHMDGLDWVYQPQYDAREKRVVGAEMLVRWIHPKFGNVRADSFIPLAEQAGLIHQITRKVITRALETLESWERTGRQCKLSINISANDLASAYRVDDILAQFRDHAARLTLEVTETAIMKNMDAIVLNAERLKSAGFRLSLDDYGTGYSSLARLRDINFDEIKIDRRFIQNLTRSSRDLTLIKASIALTHELGAKAVAEGVEDLETARLLVDLGCDVLQGYAISEPLSAEKLDAFLAGDDFHTRLESAGDRDGST